MAGTIAWSISLIKVLDIIGRYNNNIMNNKVKVILDKIILWLFLSLGFFTPIIFTSSTAEFYEFPKMFFVYFVGSTLLAVFLTSKILFGGKKLMLPDWRVLGFLGLTFLSTIFSSHFYTSIWGYYSRFNGGLVSYLWELIFWTRIKREKLLTQFV